MTASQNPADAQDTAPPPPPASLPQSPPPAYQHELPADASSATRTHVEQNGKQQSSNAPETARSQPEGSDYTNSYRPRPQDAQNPPPRVIAPEEHHDALSADVDHALQPDHPPPAYTEMPGVIQSDNDALGAAATVADDGRVNINISQNDRSISRIIVPQLQRQLTRAQEEPAPPPPYIPEFLGGAPGQQPPPKLNIVIQVVGSRGDVQPFVALGKVLKETYGHRVRLATHPTFKDFVSENGLEFFSIGGDPAELMAFMVKNPGLMPGFDTLRSGEVGKRRRNIAEMLRGTWRSCIETGNGLGVDPLKQTVEEWMDIEERLPEELRKPFVADCIIANPPSFGHIHCAEKLGIPLHMMFTMPWSPTQQFPHPLANIQSSNTDPTVTNFMSYILVDMLTWQGLGDVTNRFRKESLGLDPISIIWAPAMLARLKIPWTYCWSPALIPKPKDWAHHIQISGFYFLNLATNYTPAPDLAAFLAAGEPPVYIGFGSIVVDDPNAMTDMIFKAVKITGRRALVSKGWGGLGGDDLAVPDGVFMLGNVPHDWLFKHVAAVVHHGGAGTTAAGIAAGRPTVVVPFFGDQPFWGAMTAKAGAGPEPVPYKDLTAEKLADSILKALTPESLERAKELSVKISKEQGSQNGAQSFHQMLNYEDLRCALAPQHPAVWRVKRTQVRLSAKVATVLAQAGELDFSNLKLFRPREYETDEGPWDPISGGAAAIVGTATQMMMGVADFPIETLKLLHIHPDAKKNGKGKAKATEGGSVSESTNHEARPENLRNSTQGSVVSSTSGTPTPGSTSKPSYELPDLSISTEPGKSSLKSTFMAQAMALSSEVAHPRSPSRDRASRMLSPGGSSLTHSKSLSAADSQNGSSRTHTERKFIDNIREMNAEHALHTGKGVARIVSAGFKSPLDFSLNIARGFHNVPKLYGAEVRQVDKVTDFESGVRTAAKEFGLGFYDGITGMVTDPIKGAKKEGAAGFVKGVGRGIFSLPFRVMGGAWSVPAYTMKGLYQQILKEKGSNVQNYIIVARIDQGYEEASTISAAERADIIARWKEMQKTIKKKQTPAEHQAENLHKFVEHRKAKRKERIAKIHERFRRTGSTPTTPVLSSGHSSPGFEEPPSQVGTRNTDYGQPMHRAYTLPSSAPSLPNDNYMTAEEEKRQLEAAIQASIAETSRGNPEEDELLARAIRASIAEFERDSAPEEDEEQVLERVMMASLQEAQRAGATEAAQQALEETLRQSLSQNQGLRQHSTDSEWDSDEDEHDEEYHRIIAESQKMAESHHSAGHDELAVKEEEELKHALEESAKAHQHAPNHIDAHEEELRKALAESEKLHQSQPQANTGADEEEALKKAMEESALAEKERETQKEHDEIVLEYIKKQSLADLRGKDIGGESSGAGARGGRAH